MKFNHIIFCVGLFLPIKVWCQDSFFNHFHDKQSLYNPAAVGISNSFSTRAILKSQWKTAGHLGYHSMILGVEDAMPCSLFDWGIHIIGDQEGAGRFQTLEGGLKIAMSLPELMPNWLGTKRHRSQHNIRLGVDLSFGQHSIDFDRLTFSDQIDPKYGFIYPTQFSAPQDNRSPIYFNPGFGAMLHSYWRTGGFKDIVTKFGASVSNSYYLGGSDLGNTSSLFDQPDVRRPWRLSLSAEAQAVPAVNGKGYLSINPLFFYQMQGGLHYLEIGSSIDISSLVEVGVYMHNTAFLVDGTDTNWLSFIASFNIKTTPTSRTILSANYATHYSGISNQLGPLFEVSITHHIGNSVGCRLLGKADAVLYNNNPICPILDISPSHKKMYENIWYKN